MGHWSTCPLDFQLFNFSGHFRAAQTLTLDSINSGCLPKKNIQAYSFVTVYCMNFMIIFWCVTLKLFSFSFVSQILATPMAFWFACLFVCLFVCVCVCSITDDIY